MLDETSAPQGSGYQTITVHLAVQNPGESPVPLAFYPNEAVLVVQEGREYRGKLSVDQDPSQGVDSYPAEIMDSPLMPGAELCGYHDRRAGDEALTATFDSVPAPAHLATVQVPGLQDAPISTTRAQCSAGSPTGVRLPFTVPIPSSEATSGSSITIESISDLTRQGSTDLTVNVRVDNHDQLDPLSIKDLDFLGVTKTGYLDQQFDGALVGDYLCTRGGVWAGPGVNQVDTSCFRGKMADYAYVVVVSPSLGLAQVLELP